MASIFPDTSVNNPETGFGWKDGDVWYDPESGITYVWYNPVWKTGSIDNIGASVEVGDTAPVAPEVGDLWWKTPDNLLYVWYSDDDSDQWVIASPPLNINTDLFVETTGDNMTGDLTLGTNKITLDAGTGAAEFASYVSSDTFFWSKNTDSVNAGLYLYNYDGNPNRADAAFAVSSTNGSTAHTVTIDYDGKATFATEVVAGVRDQNGVLMTSAGTTQGVSGGVSRYALSGADGSATFSGSVVSGSLAPGGGGGNYFSVGEVAAYAAKTTNTLFRGWDASGSANNLVVSIFANGNATFAGNITANGSVLTRASGDLDVGERLEKADIALKALKVAAAAATDFASLQAAIATSLASI